MTKPRPPLSIDAALARIAGQLPGSWGQMAKVADRAVDTVRAWGDQDKPEDVPMKAAIALDIEYRRAGGEGRPIFDVYQLLLELDENEQFPDQACAARSAARLAIESGEAVAALAELALPDASAADEAEAMKHLEEAALAINEPLARLAARRKPPARPP